MLQEFDSPPPEGPELLKLELLFNIQRKIKEKYDLDLHPADLYDLLSRRIGHVLESKIPSNIKRGSTASIYAKIKRIGHVQHTFLSLLIIDPDNRQLWYPNPSTWDSTRDRGKLNLMDQEHSIKWTFSIPPDSKCGEYKALILFWADPDSSQGIIDRRRIVDFNEKTFEVLV
jgi:hypothetical protein